MRFGLGFLGFLVPYCLTRGHSADFTFQDPATDLSLPVQEAKKSLAGSNQVWLLHKRCFVPRPALHLLDGKYRKGLLQPSRTL